VAVDFHPPLLHSWQSVSSSPFYSTWEWEHDSADLERFHHPHATCGRRLSSPHLLHSWQSVSSSHFYRTWGWERNSADLYRFHRLPSSDLYRFHRLPTLVTLSLLPPSDGLICSLDPAALAPPHMCTDRHWTCSTKRSACNATQHKGERCPIRLSVFRV
jgi:hypothetical protein